jgi:hypothetical protein
MNANDIVFSDVIGIIDNLPTNGHSRYSRISNAWFDIPFELRENLTADYSNSNFLKMARLKFLNDPSKELGLLHYYDKGVREFLPMLKCRRITLTVLFSDIDPSDCYPEFNRERASFVFDALYRELKAENHTDFMNKLKPFLEVSSLHDDDEVAKGLFNICGFSFQDWVQSSERDFVTFKRTQNYEDSSCCYETGGSCEYCDCLIKTKNWFCNEMCGVCLAREKILSSRLLKSAVKIQRWYKEQLYHPDSDYVNRVLKSHFESFKMV